MTDNTRSLSGLLKQLHVPEVMLKRLGWATAGYGIVQAIRFGSNLVLTRILAPDLFGVMILLTTLRVGIELFTDIGIAQNVVSSKNAEDPRFYNTAWTLQILRGLLLALLTFVLVPVFRSYYDDPRLSFVLPFMAAFFILTGGTSIGLPLAVKRLATHRTATFEVVSTLLGTVALILSSWLSPDILGLVIGNVLASCMPTILSYFILRDLRYRPMIDRTYAFEIIGFGKWVFVSSVVFFLSSNLDRLVLAKYVSFAALGVYGIARSLADVFASFSVKLGSELVFPSVAASDARGAELQRRLAHRRGQFVFASAAAIGSFVAVSDVLVSFLYDSRYHGAAVLLPWVCLSAWMMILNTLNENVMLGLGAPKFSAFGSVAKLAGLLVLLPLALQSYGIVAAGAALVAAECLRYASLSIGQARHGIGFARQDVLATLILLGTAFVLRAAMFQAGLGAPAHQLFLMHRL